MFNVFSENREMEKVESDGRRRRVPLLILPAKSNLLTKETEVRLVSY